jgi:AP2-like factor (ANT lineage)
MIVLVMMPPKLEDFLGGATMETHHEYEGHETETMALSLDSIYYNNNVEQQDHSELACHGMYHQASLLEQEEENKEEQRSG